MSLRGRDNSPLKKGSSSIGFLAQITRLSIPDDIENCVEAGSHPRDLSREVGCSFRLPRDKNKTGNSSW